MFIILYKYELIKYLTILDSEQSNGCTDFTMMCVFFLSVITFVANKNASIFYFSILPGQEVNLAIRISNSFQNRQENQKKITKKRKSIFFYFLIIQKRITLD